MVQKVLVFGDIGIDDTVALLYGYLNDEIEIVGIVADYGNISRERAVANIQYVKSRLDPAELEGVPIILGAEFAMTSDPPDFAYDIHGEYGLGPIIPPEGMQDGVTENFFRVAEIIEAYQDELVIVNTGRLTSLATMFMYYSNLMSNVKSFYLMGGAFWVPGNATAVSEANFYGDPIAVKLVLNHARDVTIIPLNVTEQAIATPQMVNYIDRVGQIEIIKPMLDFYYNFYKQRNPAVQGSPLHDVLTLMAVIHNDMLRFQQLPVHVVQEQNRAVRGQSIADIRPYVNLDDAIDAREHRIALQLDYREFYRDFMTVMTGQQF
ncbi:nucleoside hydrolase [Lentibacillus sediminis]|uniref:nucleoside hydrolase n=1 Tax=Lentibacillus sediminis TaxID=1940529 RepID=UPI000C1B86E3|nr:nucleoside hydrolase [Lentibacillus sediminis]